MIKLRAKRLDNSEYVYGSLITVECGTFIIQSGDSSLYSTHPARAINIPNTYTGQHTVCSIYPVDAETVQQFTGYNGFEEMYRDVEV